MPTFRYRAYALNGAFAEGTVEASSIDAANDALWLQGLTPFQMRATQDGDAKWWNRDIVLGSGARSADLMYLPASSRCCMRLISH